MSDTRADIRILLVDDSTNDPVLAEAGCDVAQGGYLYGRPVPADEFPGVTTAWSEHARPV